MEEYGCKNCGHEVYIEPRLITKEDREIGGSIFYLDRNFPEKPEVVLKKIGDAVFDVACKCGKHYTITLRAPPKKKE